MRAAAAEESSEVGVAGCHGTACRHSEHLCQVMLQVGFGSCLYICRDV